MSYRILATTDLSTNSKTGLRFAIQLASQTGAEIVFFHIADISKPAPWSDKNYPDYEKTEVDKKMIRLKKFAGKIYDEAEITPGPGEYEVQVGEQVDELIIDFAREKNIDLICMSTRGAGMFRRFIGTHTSSVLSDAPVPVMAIPKSYRRRAVSKVLYASDFKDLAYELTAIRRITHPLDVRILVYHYTLTLLKEDEEVIEEKIKAHAAPDVEFRLKPQNLENTLVENIKEDSAKVNASLIVMFNHQSNDWVEQLFDTSKSADLTFDSRLPVLVIPKRKV
ncbi:MAG: universal stress protein [Bacteroidetes bacterium]|nr:universal stress protein [Bacteroidota bacterium]